MSKISVYVKSECGHSWVVSNLIFSFSSIPFVALDASSNFFSIWLIFSAYFSIWDSPMSSLLGLSDSGSNFCSCESFSSSFSDSYKLHSLLVPYSPVGLISLLSSSSFDTLLVPSPGLELLLPAMSFNSSSSSKIRFAGFYLIRSLFKA